MSLLLLLSPQPVFTATPGTTEARPGNLVPGYRAVTIATTTVGSTRDTSWAISDLTPVTATHATTWTTIARVAPTHATTWTVRTPVGTSRVTTWAARTRTTDTRATTWQILAPVESTRGTSWFTDSNIQVSSRPFLLLGLTGHTLTVVTPTTTTVESTRDTSWGVAGVLTPVTATRGTTWAVTAPVTAAHATTWAARTTVAATRATTWAARSVTAGTRATTWAARTTVTTSHASTWATSGTVTETQTTTWATSGTVTATRATGWATLAAATGGTATPVTITPVDSRSGTATGLTATITLPTYLTTDTTVLFVASNNANAQTFSTNVTATSVASAGNRLNVWQITPQDAAQTTFTLSVGVSSVLTWWIGTYRDVDPTLTAGAAINRGNNTTAVIEAIPATGTIVGDGNELVLSAFSVNSTATWATPGTVYNTTAGNAALLINTAILPAGALTAVPADADRGLEGTSRNESTATIVLVPASPTVVRNRLTNPSFEDAAQVSAGWETEATVVGTPAFTKVTSGAVDGTRVQQMQYAGQTGDSGLFAIYQSPIPATPGEVLTFTIWLSGSKANCSLIVGIEGFGTGQVYISEADTAVATLTATMTEYTVTYTVPPDAVAVACYVQANEIVASTAITAQLDKATLTTPVVAGGGIPTRGTSWATAQQVTDTRGSTWNVAGTLATVTATRTTSWAVAGTITTVTATRSSTWTTTAPVTATRASTWTATARVTATHATTWAARATTTTTHATTWAARSTLAANRATTWATTSAVTGTRSSTWATTQPVTNTRATNWNVAGALFTVAATRGTTWNVAGALVTVTAARGSTWTTRAFTTTAHASSWTVRTPVTPAIRGSTWAILTPAATSRSSTWTTRAPVTTARATAWTTRARLATSKPATWDTLTRLTATHATTWLVGTTVTSTRGTTWAQLEVEGPIGRITAVRLRIPAASGDLSTPGAVGHLQVLEAIGATR